jgi:hypothetical protein
MSTYERIVEAISERATARATGIVIRNLQGMHEGLQSGDDSGLTSLWDEVCVQVQIQHSVLWSLYEDIIDSLALDAINRLSQEERCAIWLQTDEGQEWVDELDQAREQNDTHVDDKPRYSAADVVRWVSDSVLDKAADWTNPRIRHHIENSMLD